MTVDPLTLFETFVRIADAGSISSAARQLGLSQPAASRHLARLESMLQTQLAQRTTHNLALTDAGRELLADARQLLDDWSAIEEKHRSGRKEIQGSLRVVAPVALGQSHLSKIAWRFQLEHPRLTLSWELDDSVIRFSEVGCDCWIRVGAVPDETLVVKNLASVERLLVVAPELRKGLPKRTSPQDLEQLPFVALSPFEGGRIPLHHAGAGKEILEPWVRLRTNNIFALRDAAVLGLGAAVLPRWFIDRELTSGELVDVLPRWRAPTLPVHVAYRPDRYRPLRLRAFLDALRSGLKDIRGLETTGS